MDTIKDLVEMAADLTGLDIELNERVIYKITTNKGDKVIMQSSRKEECEAYLDGLLFTLNHVDDVLATRFLKQARARS